MGSEACQDNNVTVELYWRNLEVSFKNFNEIRTRYIATQTATHRGEKSLTQ
jgi:hypothetical protein